MRENKDAHLIAALKYSINWINNHSASPLLEYRIEHVDEADYYQAISKGDF